MTLFERYRKAREKATAEYDSQLDRLIKRLQSSFWTTLEGILPDLSLDDNGNIKNQIGNTQIIGKATKAVERDFRSQRNRLWNFIVLRSEQLLRFNRSYFRAVADPSEKLQNRVTRIVLLNLGYDVVKKQIVSGGWLDSLGDDKRLTADIARDMRNAIQGEVGFREFQSQFRGRFTGTNGLGYLERNFETFSRDLFMQVDRTTQKEYAKNLGLEYFLYSGTEKDNTRDFCKDRIQNYYTSDEIKTWEDLDFKGKYLVGYDPFTHCGGYNCRHHLSAVSKEFLEVQGLLNQVNKYN